MTDANLCQYVHRAPCRGRPVGTVCNYPPERHCPDTNGECEAPRCRKVHHVFHRASRYRGKPPKGAPK